MKDKIWMSSYKRMLIEEKSLMAKRDLINKQVREVRKVLHGYNEQLITGKVYTNG